MIISFASYILIAACLVLGYSLSLATYIIYLIITFPLPTVVRINFSITVSHRFPYRRYLPYISPSLSILGSPDKYHCHSASAYSKFHLRSVFVMCLSIGFSIVKPTLNKALVSSKSTPSIIFY